jgi:hypothetical protein
MENGNNYVTRNGVVMEMFSGVVPIICVLLLFLFFREKWKRETHELRTSIEETGQTVYEGANKDLLDLVVNLNGLGISTETHTRDEALEKEMAGSRWNSKSSRGILYLKETPLDWITILHRRGDPPKWWYLFGLRDDRIGTIHRTKLRTIRKKSFPIFGKVLDTDWSGNDHHTNLLQTLSEDSDIDGLAERLGNITVESHTQAFHGWVIEFERNPVIGDPFSVNSNWAAIQKMGDLILKSPAN